MCITEEEYRQLHRQAIQVLEQFKEREKSLNMEIIHNPNKSIKVHKRRVCDAHKKKRHQKINFAAVEFSSQSLFDFFWDSGGDGVEFF